MGAGMGRGGISCSAACCLLSLTPRHQDTKNCGMGGRRIPGILGVFVANQSHGAPGGRALPGEDHGQGCPWHTGAAGHFSGARTFSPQRVRGAGRGPCTCPSACGLGSPRSRGIPTGRDARGTLRALVHALGLAPFCSGAASRADRERGPQPAAPPVGTRRRSATKCNAAKRACAGTCQWLPRRQAGLEARVPGEFPRAGMPVAHWRGWAFPGARTCSPKRVRGVRRGACACPLAGGLGSPRSRGPCSRLGISPERGLLVRSGCGAHGAAHAPALRPAGLEARAPGEMPTGRDARGTLRALVHALGLARGRLGEPSLPGVAAAHARRAGNAFHATSAVRRRYPVASTAWLARAPIVPAPVHGFRKAACPVPPARPALCRMVRGAGFEPATPSV